MKLRCMIKTLLPKSFCSLEHFASQLTLLNTFYSLTHFTAQYTLGTIHLRRRQIFKIFDPSPLPSAFQQKAYEGKTVNTWGHSSPQRHADILSGWSLTPQHTLHLSTLWSLAHFALRKPYSLEHFTSWNTLLYVFRGAKDVVEDNLQIS